MDQRTRDKLLWEAEGHLAGLRKKLAHPDSNKEQVKGLMAFWEKRIKTMDLLDGKRRLYDV